MTRATRHRQHVPTARRSSRIAMIVAAALVLASCTGDDTTGQAENGGTDDQSSTVSDDPDAPLEIEHRISISLCDDRGCRLATDEQIDALEARLDADDDIVEVYFQSPEEAYDRLLELYEDRPRITDPIEPHHLFASFRVTLHAEADPAAFVERYQGLPGVDRAEWLTEDFEERLAQQAEGGRQGVAIFLCNEHGCPAPITESERTSLRADLESDPEIVEITFESAEEAHANFLEMFADDPVMTEGVREGVLPEAFRLIIDDEADAREVGERYTSHPGVEDVVWGTVIE